MFKASEWIWHLQLRPLPRWSRKACPGWVRPGKSPIEALQAINPKLPKEILLLPPILLEDRIPLLEDAYRLRGWEE